MGLTWRSISGPASSGMPHPATTGVWLNDMRFHALTSGPTRLRPEDRWGTGHFNAPRQGRSHRGVDIVVVPGESVLAPFGGTIVREARPYAEDPRFGGLLLQGAEEWATYQAKLFYLEPIGTAERVQPGDPVGTAQDIALKYPGIIAHVHLELWRGDTVIDPTPFLPGPDAP